MKIEPTYNNTYYPSFRAIKLSDTEMLRAKTVIESCIDNLNIEIQKNIWTRLYNIFRPHIEKEAASKSGKFCIYSDVLSELKVLFFETLNDIKLNDGTVKKLITVINEYTPTKDTMKAKYLYKSLDNGASLTNGTFINSENTTNTRLPNPDSAATKEEYRNKLAETIDDKILTAKEKARMKAKGNGKSMAAIARDENVNPSVVQNSIKKGILKIQKKNGQIPVNYKETAVQFAESLGCTTEDALSFICKMPQIKYLSLTNIWNHISGCSNLLNIPKERYIKLGIQKPNYFCYNHETKAQNIQDCSEIMHCTYDFYIKLCKKDPSLSNIKPKTLQKYLNDKTKLFGCPPGDMIKTTNRMPAFIYTKLSTMKKYIKKLTEVLQCSREEAIDFIMEQPSAMFYKKSLLKKRIKDGAKILGCTEEEFAKLCLKQQTLITLSTETLKTHVEDTSKLLGCTKEAFIELCKTRPTLLCMNPELLKQKNDILNYYKKIKNEATSTTLLSLDSTNTLYMRILAYLLNKNYDAKINIMYSNKYMPEYLKQADKIYKLKIPDDTAAKGFTDFVQEYSTKILGKNIFEFEII